jgi:hypothetical protein
MDAQTNDPVLQQMQALISHWQAEQDQRAVFLTCYRMMTANMLAALETDEFQDRLWVELLLNRFAGYYFRALEAYDTQAETAPPVWQLAHRSALEARSSALQKLLLGVNAHINYDLVLTVEELLAPEWDTLVDAQRAARYQDYTRVNQIIAATIDAVQDQILEPDAPILDLFDRLLGRVDERLISALITSWREHVWRSALELLAESRPPRRAEIVRRVETEALRLAALID